MIINRKSGIAHGLYLVSPLKDLEKEILIPRVPQDFLTRSKFSDWQTKRLVFYPSIDKALVGLSMTRELAGETLYVYQPLGIRSENIIKPGITSSPVVRLTDESWVLTASRLKYVASIKVKSKLDSLSYRYGTRSTEGKLYTWKWEEILQPWEKKGKLKTFSKVKLPRLKKRGESILKSIQPAKYVDDIIRISLKNNIKNKEKTE